ncbi:sulfotransferase ssu-1 [Ixodes scapularis]
MSAEKRVPVTQDIDGEACFMCYDPVLYRQVPSFEPREGDIIQVSFPRSGSHWIQQILQLILNSGESAESYVDFAKKAPYLENRVPDGMESPRLLRTHFSMDRIKVDPKAKYLYVARNPLDCCVSCYHYVREIPVCKFQDGTFDEFLDAFLEGHSSFGDFFDHVLSGYRRRKERNVFFVTYEELQRDKKGSILKLARFLGEDYEEMLKNRGDILQSILEKSSTVFMKDLMKTTPKEMREVLMEASLQAPPLEESGEDKGYDSTTINIVRQGGVGGWRKYFSEDGIQKMRAKIDENIRKYDIMSHWEDI